MTGAWPTLEEVEAAGVDELRAWLEHPPPATVQGTKVIGPINDRLARLERE